MSAIPVEDRVGAFVPGGRFEVSRYRRPGHSRERTFAAKDLIDVRGRRTSAGNPTWALRARPLRTPMRPSSRALLEAGATLVGKTVLDEFAFGVAGINAHHGTPVNPAAPGHLAGGSSCGSAAAVAAGLCDFALGTDTGGSVRIPASYCGLFGIRPSHGRVSLDGVVPLAPTLDTAGWLARDAATFVAVGDVLLPSEPTPPPTRVGLATDAVAMLPGAAQRRARALFDTVARLVGRGDELALAGPVDRLDELQAAYRSAQGHEAWLTHRSWIEAHPDALGPMAAERFRVAAAVSEADARAGRETFERYRGWLADTLADGGVICLPTTPGAAPKADGDADAMAAERLRTLALTAPASAAGAPQVTLPALELDGHPLGFSLLGAPGTDRALLRLAADLAAALTHADDGGPHA